MILYEQLKDDCLKIGDLKITIDKGINSIEEFDSVIAVMSKLSDVFLLNESGIVWQYSKNTITEIWRKDKNTLCMYDGQADIWLDVNKLEVIRTIWNPWGLDNPENFK